MGVQTLPLIASPLTKRNWDPDNFESGYIVTLCTYEKERGFLRRRAIPIACARQQIHERVGVWDWDAFCLSVHIGERTADWNYRKNGVHFAHCTRARRMDRRSAEVLWSGQEERSYIG